MTSFSGSPQFERIIRKFFPNASDLTFYVYLMPIKSYEIN